MFRYAAIDPESGLTVEEVPAAGDAEILRALQQAVGGDIERFHTNQSNLDGFADEEGLRKNQPYNQIASRLLYLLSGLAHRIVGPVVFTSRADNTAASLTDQHLTLVAATYNRLVPEAQRVPVPTLVEPEANDHGDDHPTAEFYSLPATKLEEGMSTADGQDIVSVNVHEGGGVSVEVYTPRSDDSEQDAANREETETRYCSPGERVQLAVFADTDVDGRDLDGAQTEE